LEDGDWIGIGCGAHSTRDGVRWKNVSATEEYDRPHHRGEPTATTFGACRPTSGWATRCSPGCA
jgi:coproporphyrinogen III oxidase-like Fe-S oxidoreductase